MASELLRLPSSLLGDSAAATAMEVGTGPVFECAITIAVDQAQLNLPARLDVLK
jgi:hypothetical protein